MHESAANANSLHVANHDHHMIEIEGLKQQLLSLQAEVKKNSKVL